MEASAILGELLYIVSNFEKGRFKTNKIWNIRYKTSLRESLFFMLKIVQIIKKDIHLSDTTIGDISHFYKKNINIIFCKNSFDIDELTSVLKNLYIPPLEDEKICVIVLMEKILNECITLHSKSFLNYKRKQELSLLLKSLHNLPRVFFNTSKQILCDSYVSALQPSEAISFALTYLKSTACSKKITLDGTFK